MSILSTILVFVILPAAVFGGVAALAARGGSTKGPDRRYRPGRPYEFAPIWFLSAPRKVGAEAESHAPALEAAAGSVQKPGPVGGASDRW